MLQRDTIEVGSFNSFQKVNLLSRKFFETDNPLFLFKWLDYCLGIIAEVLDKFSGQYVERSWMSTTIS